MSKQYLLNKRHKHVEDDGHNLSFSDLVARYSTDNDLSDTRVVQGIDYRLTV